MRGEFRHICNHERIYKMNLKPVKTKLYIQVRSNGGLFGQRQTQPSAVAGVKSNIG